MEVVQGIAILAQLLNTVSNAAAQASTVSAMIQQAQSEGRTTFTDAEWQQIDNIAQAGRQALLDAITKALGKP